MNSRRCLGIFLPKKLTRQFDELTDYAQRINELNDGSAFGFVVIKDGAIVTERYAGYHSHLPGARPVQADSQFNVASARKSFIGCAVALAVHEGKIRSIDEPVRTYLPELDPLLMDGTTIRHLLTHTHGLTADAAGRAAREFAPGADWAYENINIEMLTALVRRVTGQSVARHVQERVFEPLGFTETAWRTEPDERLVQVVQSREGAPDSALGTTADGDGDEKNLFVSTRELAYWGYLHLNRGVIGGRQIVPREVIAMATSLQAPASAPADARRNGFLWFVQDRPSTCNQLGEQLPVGSYQIVGVTGPLLLVVPEQNLVVVRMYNRRYNYAGPDGSDYLFYLREFGNRVMAGCSASNWGKSRS